MRNKVNETAARLKYEPDWHARSLRLKKTDIIGVIIPDISDYFFSKVVLGIQNYFEEINRNIILFNTKSDEILEEKYLRIAASRKVDGIILATISNNPIQIRKLIDQFDIPIVIIDNKINIERIDFVLSNDIERASKLVNHLIITHKLKKIACISGSQKMNQVELIHYWVIKKL